MAELTRFLRAQAGRRFDWAGSHCLLLPADWMVALGLPDPAAPWRETIRDEATARGLLAEAGGVVALASAAMAAAGVAATHAVRRGDVGVVTVMGPEGRAEVGAICTGARWAVRSSRGVWIGPAEALAAWRTAEEV